MTCSPYLLLAAAYLARVTRGSDGYIDSSELEGVLRHYGITASREQMQQVLGPEAHSASLPIASRDQCSLAAQHVCMPGAGALRLHNGRAARLR